MWFYFIFQQFVKLIINRSLFTLEISMVMYGFLVEFLRGQKRYK